MTQQLDTSYAIFLKIIVTIVSGKVMVFSSFLCSWSGQPINHNYVPLHKLKQVSLLVGETVQNSDWVCWRKTFLPFLVLSKE